MTLARRLLCASCFPKSAAIIHMALLAAIPVQLWAQRSGEAPVAPASAIGPATTASTISVLGLASSVEGATQRSEIWMGATQSLGKLGRVRFSTIGHGDFQPRNAVAANSAVEGMMALRARARVGGAHIWSAVGYGYVNVKGGLSGTGLGLSPALGTGFDGAHVDTTVSQRVDVGAIQRAEAGVMSRVSAVEFSVGFSVERVSRVTTQTLTINESNGLPPVQMPMTGKLATTRSTRSLQRRDIATGIASMGFHTGPTTWLVSMTSPVATWVTSDALAAKPRIAPTIASVAIVQPVTGWLSLVGAAATNSASVGSTALRDDLGSGKVKRFAPVVAFGIRFAGLPGRRDDTPGGILSFETRTIGSVDSAAVDVAHSNVDAAATLERDTLRVVLFVDAPKAESVELMGDATQWLVTQMTRTRNGQWRTELKLAPGVHRITVRADGGKWMAPPSLPLGNDDYGSPVGMIVVKGRR